MKMKDIEIGGIYGYRLHPDHDPIPVEVIATGLSMRDGGDGILNWLDYRIVERDEADYSQHVAYRIRATRRTRSFRITAPWPGEVLPSQLRSIEDHACAQAKSLEAFALASGSTPAGLALAGC